MFSFIRKYIRRTFWYIVRSFKNKANRNPAYLGRSFAAGFFSAMWIGIGQMWIVFALWFVVDRLLKFRFSIVIACLTTLITNPLITPFWFYIYYLTGQFMLDESSIRFSQFTAELRPVLSTLDLDSIIESIKLLAKGIGRPILIGSLPWFPIMGAVGYWTGARIAVHLRRRQNKKKKRRIKRMISFVKNKAAAMKDKAVAVKDKANAIMHHRKEKSGKSANPKMNGTGK